MSEDSRTQITGIILSGGRGSRMGGIDKGFAELDGQPFIEWVIKCLKPQVDNLIISANREVERYTQYGYPVIRDTQSDYAGPLSGIASALFHARTRLAMIVPCDMPYLPADLVKRMFNKLDQEQADICLADDGTHLHPIVCLMKTELLEQLVNDLGAGERKATFWMKQQNYVTEDFSDCAADFRNINTEEELAN